MDKEYTVYELTDNDYLPFGPEHIDFPSVVVDGILYNCLNDNEIEPFIARWVLPDNVKTDADNSAAREILEPITELTNGKLNGTVDSNYPAYKMHHIAFHFNDKTAYETRTVGELKKLGVFDALNEAITHIAKDPTKTVTEEEVSSLFE